ncbi:hypothetical protein [Methylomonas sp. LWB]|uniref:hypothetical protein n=1 Tax=Methylomonas sp. LWB TaxID=1905845 RepID=UPI0011152FAA|nr:hypothetical protein [Methylomonas sp. LWB]
MKKQKLRPAMVGFSALCVSLFAAEASALSCTNGSSNTGMLTLNGPALNTVGNIYLNKFYTDSAFTYSSSGGNSGCSNPAAPPAAVHTPAYSASNMLCNDSPTGVSSPVYSDYYYTAYTDTGALSYDNGSDWEKDLPVVCSTGGTYQTGNTVTNVSYTSGSTVNSGTVLGLAGALKVRSSNTNNPDSPTRSVRWAQLSLVKDGSTWWLEDYYGKLFKLAGTVSEVVSGSGVNRHLTLSATALYYTVDSGTWGEWFRDNGLYKNGNTTIVPDSDYTGTDLGAFEVEVYF